MFTIIYFGRKRVHKTGESWEAERSGRERGKERESIMRRLRSMGILLVKSMYVERITAVFLFVLMLPFLPLFYIVMRKGSAGPFLFVQNRAGKGKTVFTMYKIRTMVEGVEKMRGKYAHLNEADGPVFKIRNDPRYTRVGKFLAHTGIDELPQLINIVKGEMAFVGPRPLPVDEAAKVPKKYEARFSVLPGMTSPWILAGAHRLTFAEWMGLDVKYVSEKSLPHDVHIFLRTGVLILSLILWECRKRVLRHKAQLL